MQDIVPQRTDDEGRDRTTGRGKKGRKKKRGQRECLSYLPLKACLHTASYQKETGWFNEKTCDNHHQKGKGKKKKKRKRHLYQSPWAHRETLFCAVETPSPPQTPLQIFQINTSPTCIRAFPQLLPCLLAALHLSTPSPTLGYLGSTFSEKEHDEVMVMSNRSLGLYIRKMVTKIRSDGAIYKPSYLWGEAARAHTQALLRLLSKFGASLGRLVWPWL